MLPDNSELVRQDYIMTITLHKHDIPADLDLGNSIAVDTETQGLSMVRDKLCLVQLSAGDGNAHIVQMDRNSYDCPNLKAMLGNPKTETIYHFAGPILIFSTTAYAARIRGAHDQQFQR